MCTPTRDLCSAFLLLVVALLLGAVPACEETGEPAPVGDATLTIAATTGMVADTVRTVAGDRADVVGLINSGVDPHLYKATRRDIKRIMDADAVFYNGLLLEGKLTDTLIRAASSGKPVHAVTELVDESSLLEPEGFNGHFDPHLWMDPRAWSVTVGVVRDRLSALDPDGAEQFRANSAAYEAQILALDAYGESVLSTVPVSKRVLVTAHDAFNYFGRRYGFEVVGIQGISTESEAGVRDIERLVELLVDREIGAVFIESTVSDRNIGALVAGASARGHTVSIGGKLFSDAMGKSGTYEGTYIGMLDHNITTIVRALGGEAPERGMQGLLTPGNGG